LVSPSRVGEGVLGMQIGVADGFCAPVA
jgi:hypothetical protein